MKNLIGGLLLGAGILIGGLSGLCSLFLIVATLVSGPSSGPDLMTGIPVVLVVGGIPFVIGVGMFFLGRSILRSDPPSSAPSQPPAEPPSPPPSPPEA